jgi:ZIP family zinc transporter
VLGGVAGLAAMLLLRHFAEQRGGFFGLMGASAIDALIDKLVLGLGFQAGRRQGMLLVIAPWRPAKLLHPGPLENPPPLN